jgi:glycosyltransferase 2 family protein
MQPQFTEAENRRFVRSMRPSRMLLPVVLGLVAVSYLFYRQFDLEQFRTIDWTGHAFFWIGASFLLLVVRHFFYAFRLRSITNEVFSWRKCMELIVLWEFSSALTPTSKGGPFVMLFALTRENLSGGRTTAAIFYTMVCDAGFFVLLLPVLLGLYGPSMLYPGTTSYGEVNLASGAFFITYSLMAVYWIVLTFFLFIRPSYAKYVLSRLARLSFLKRFEPKLRKLGVEFELTAAEMRRQDWRYHLKVIAGTIGAWTCKFAMINCLIIALVPSTPIDGFTQAFIYARMVAMFIIMAFSPTPGGAGLAEMALVGFISDYVPAGIALVVALLWRGMAYYGYLLLGAVVVPAWITAKIGKKG